MATKLETRLTALEESEAKVQARVPVSEITPEEAARAYHKFIAEVAAAERDPRWANLTDAQASRIYREVCAGACLDDVLHHYSSK